MVVVKFGGTSVGAVPQIDRAARIIQSMRESRPVVVLSAMGGVTDALLHAGESAVSGQVHARDDKLWEIRSKHDQAINELFKNRSTAVAVQDTERQIWEEIQKVFTGVSLLREMSPRSRDLISSFGERLIIPIFARYLKDLGMEAEPVDAREIIITSEESEFLLVDFDETRKRCQKLAKMAKSGIMPAVDENIPIRIKNTFAPDMPGTLISAETPVHQYSVKTVTSITRMTLVSVEGRGMIGVP